MWPATDSIISAYTLMGIFRRQLLALVFQNPGLGGRVVLLGKAGLESLFSALPSTFHAVAGQDSKSVLKKCQGRQLCMSVDIPQPYEGIV